MKKFIFKVCSLIIIVLIILTVINTAYNELRSSDQYGDGKFVHVPYNISISNVGSSHGVYAFDYSDYSDTFVGFNFALISQTLSYDYRILQEYEDHFAENGIMFIPVSYVSFMMNETEKDDFESKNQRYYRFLHPSNIKEFNFSTYLGLHFFPVIYESTAGVVSIFVKGLLHRYPIIEDDYDMGNPDFDYETDAERAFRRHIVLNENGDLFINPEEKEALLDIISFCHEKNIRPIMLSTPLRSEYLDKYDPYLLDEFYGVVAEVQNKTGCEYYDYTHDERFLHSSQYMRNSDHLSPDGAKIFTEIVMDEIVNKK